MSPPVKPLTFFRRGLPRTSAGHLPADSWEQTAAPAVTAGPSGFGPQQHGHRQQEESDWPAFEPDQPVWSQNRGHLARQAKPRDHAFPPEGVSDASQQLIKELMTF